MSRSQKLLQEIRLEIKHNREKINSKKQRLYELQTGILKFCIDIESFQHAWKSKELEALCQNLFAHVKNTLGETNFISQIKVLETEIDTAIICLENNKISSPNLKLFRLYLENLRSGGSLHLKLINQNKYWRNAYRKIKSGKGEPCILQICLIYKRRNDYEKNNS